MEDAPHDGNHGSAAATISLPSTSLRIAGLDQRAMFIIGAPRSGTTLLYKLLCLHPESAWISNYQRRLPALPAVSAISRLPASMPSARSAAWFGDGQAYRYSGERSRSEWAFPAPVEGEPFFEACGMTLDGAPSEVSSIEQQRRLRRRVRRLCQAQGASYFVSKRIGHNQRLPVLYETFPQARFVHLIRDGRSVAASLRKVDWWSSFHLAWFGGTPTEWEAAGRDPWCAAAEQWVFEIDSIEAGLAAVDPELVLQVRYEDLLAAPNDMLDEIMRFTGLTSTQEMERVAATFAGNPRPPALSSGALATVSEIQGETLDRLGYGPIS